MAKSNIPMIITTRIPIAIGIDFSKNFGYSLLWIGSGDLFTMYKNDTNKVNDGLSSIVIESHSVQISLLKFT